VVVGGDKLWNICDKVGNVDSINNFGNTGEGKGDDDEKSAV
jgi:hypothetical protein